MSRSNQRRINPDIKKKSQRRNWQRMGRMLMLGLMLALTAIAGLWLNQQWSTKVWDITADADIKAAIEAKLAAMPAKDFLSMRPELLQQQWLHEIADLQSVRISRVLPDQMHIQADARQPIALWQDEQGALHLFDELGVAYRLLNNGESPDLPLLRVNQDQLMKVKQMLDAIAQQGDDKLASLSEIRANDQYWQIYFSGGVSWLIPYRNEVQVINHINHFMQQPRWRHRYWRIDARLQSRWFVRPARHGGVI